MFKKMLEEIKKYNKIIIIRHKVPDYDAYGSQVGLYLSLKEEFPKKEIYIDGDENQNNLLGIKMHSLNKYYYEDSLVIVTDTSSTNMLYDCNALLAKKVLIFDHHENTPDFGDVNLVDPACSSASELIADFLYSSNIKITPLAANYLYIGIVGDSNRFLYKGTTSKTFAISSRLIDDGADITECYKLMQKEEKENEKRFKGYVLSNFKIYDKIAYIYTDKKTLINNNVQLMFASRGCINLLSGIEGIEAFVGFTESLDTDDVYIEFRSKNISIVDVAKSIGGGGHALACGARIKMGDDIMPILEKVNEVVKK